MGTLALLVLIMLAASQRPARGVPPTAALPSAAHEHAHRLHRKAQATNKPEDHAAAAAAAATAAKASAATATKTTQAATVPRPWPQAVPKGLPPWPAGWTPASPPTPGIVARAWQLLPTLWAKGQGSIKTEQTDGQWITYLATHTGNTKGVVAFKIKPGSPRGGAPVAMRGGGGKFGGGGASADFG
jgi:uncharacterized membrane protein YgcG